MTKVGKNYTFIEKRVENVNVGDVYVQIAYSSYDEVGWRDVNYNNMKILEVNDEYIVVEGNIKIYGRKVGNSYYYRIKTKD